MNPSTVFITAIEPPVVAEPVISTPTAVIETSPIAFHNTAFSSDRLRVSIVALL